MSSRARWPRRAISISQQPQAVEPARADATPSTAAFARLATAVAGETDAYRTTAAVDLTLLDALVHMGRPEDAAATLEDHRRALRTFAASVESAVADAAVEREAEQVLTVSRAGGGRVVPGARPGR